MRRYDKWAYVYRLTALPNGSVSPVKIEEQDVNDPRDVVGVAQYVCHTDFSSRFWCAIKHNGEFWLHIGDEAFKASEVFFKLTETRLTFTIDIVSSAGTMRSYTLWQPWVSKPWTLLDITYDASDQEAAAFPVFLKNSIESSQWWEHLSRGFPGPTPRPDSQSPFL